MFRSNGAIARTLLVAFLVLSGAANAQQYSHEISGAATGSIGFQGSNTNINVFLGYAHALGESLQVVANFSFSDLAVVGGSSSNVSLTVGPQFNFMMSKPGDLVDAAYAGATAGFNSAGTGGSPATTDLAYSAFAGKRFRLADQISYKAEVTYIKVGDADGTFALVPIGLSVHL